MQRTELNVSFHAAQRFVERVEKSSTSSGFIFSRYHEIARKILNDKTVSIIEAMRRTSPVDVYLNGKYPIIDERARLVLFEGTVVTILSSEMR